MNSKSFIFGKNYDSDYLCGERLTRRTVETKDDRHPRRRHKTHRNVKRRTKPDAIQKSRDGLPKTYEQRLTLKPTIHSSKYVKCHGLFDNGKTSEVINKNKQFLKTNPRIREDLFWILKHKNNDERRTASISSQQMVHSSPEQNHFPIRHKTVYAGKQTQIDSEMSSRQSYRYRPDVRQEISQENFKRSKRQMIAQKSTANKTNSKYLTKTMVKAKDSRLSRKQSPEEESECSIMEMMSDRHNCVMPSLPDSLSIARSLFESYDKERKIFAKEIGEFDVDLVTERRNSLKHIAIKHKQSIEQNFGRSQQMNDKKSIASMPKILKSPKKKVYDINSDDSVRQLSMIPYNGRDIDVVMKRFEPKVTNILSKLLLDISHCKHFYFYFAFI